MFPGRGFEAGAAAFAAVAFEKTLQATEIGLPERGEGGFLSVDRRGDEHHKLRVGLLAELV
jgi:hypothetical protein